MRYKKEQGQALILIVIAMFGLVAMAALIIDGGNAYLNRRNAQTAADAGALAGAFERCVNGGNDLEIEAAITQYAVAENNASALDSWEINADDDVEVVVSLTSNTFFAKIFGASTGTVRAMAAAGCFTPKAVHANLLPVAFSCRQPEGQEPQDPLEDCIMQSIPYGVMEQIRNSGFNFDADLLDVGDDATAASYQTDLGGTGGEGKLIYVVMNDQKFDYEQDCVEAGNGGTVTCDFDGDDIYDVASGAERGWLFLDGDDGANNGADQLSDIVIGGTLKPATIYTWYAGKSGVNASVFGTVQEWSVGDYALIPVYDALCTDVNADKDEFIAKCSPYDPVVDYIEGKTGESTYFRVIAFAPYYVTCVSKNNEYCPGAELAGIPKGGSIEGYFVEGYTTGGNVGGEFELGAYIITLTQ